MAHKSTGKATDNGKATEGETESKTYKKDADGREYVTVGLKVYRDKNQSLCEKLLKADSRSTDSLIALGKFYGITVDTSHERERMSDEQKAVVKLAQSTVKASVKAHKSQAEMLAEFKAALEKAGIK